MWETAVKKHEESLIQMGREQGIEQKTERKYLNALFNEIVK